MSEHSAVEGAGAAVGLAAMGWKYISGLAAGAGVAAGLAAVVVMCAMRPRDDREWAISLISTVMCSIGMASGLVIYFDLQHLIYSFFGLLSLGGLFFGCGLPGWALVRWLFNYINKRADADITEVAPELAGMAKSVKDKVL